MNTLNPSRVQIYLKKSKVSSESTLAQFGSCIVDFFGFADHGSGFVGFREGNNQITIFGVDSSEDSEAVLLRHATECPVYRMDKSTILAPELKDRGVGVGVAVLLSSADDCVLVTRRAMHMRTFPGVWVPPGGHIELGETLLDAGLRELREETGLNLDDSTHHILGLWESVYPHKLEFGEPIRQHIVTYLALKSKLSSKELSELIKLDPEETDAALWLPYAFVEKLSTGNTIEEMPEFLSILQESDGTMTQVQVETAPLVDMIAPPPDTPQLEIERLSWGTRFALQQWVRWNRNSAGSNSKL